MKTYQIVAQIIRDAHKDLGQDYIFDDQGGYTWWTRGDGSRYKDMCKINPRGYGLETTKKVFKDEYEASDWMWDRLESMATKLLEVRDEFPSNGFRKAAFVRGLLFIKNSCTIEYATKSVLKNTSVWYSRPRTESA